ncbi:MAG: MASE1 domain-containing protein [Planctomycetes bacterium]|nr:MASE1 domain-containing protein [Planctomycetota bacterium]
MTVPTPAHATRYLRQLLALATAYALLGWLGQAVAVQQVTAVWPPSGVALAALLLGGARLWPGVLLGSLVVNAAWPEGGVSLFSLSVSACMGLGGTASALLGSFLVRRHAGGTSCLERSGDTFRFALFAGPVSGAVAATVGVSTLVLAGRLPTGAFAATWTTWWLGDTAGVLLVAPPLFAWAAGRPEPADLRRGGEALVLTALLAVVGLVAFGGWDLGPSWYPLAYVVVPGLVVAAFRFGARGATALTLFVAALALWGTVQGRGPFARPTRGESLALLQVFFAVIALTELVLCAVLAEARARALELARLLAEVREARAAAEQANRAKSTFLANMGHELHTPLNAVIGYSELVAEEVGELERPDLVGDLAKIGAAARSLDHILTDILDLARLEAGRMQVTPERFELAPFLQAACAEAEALAAKNASALTVRLSPELGAVRLDQPKLRQVVGNLLSNAAKFTERGTIVLEASRAAAGGAGVPRKGRGAGAGARADAETCDEIRVSVRDSGIGMTPVQVGHLFRAFTQADPSATRKFGGTGLGLAIAQEFCRLMGGAIEVVSAPGQGSTFTVRLPAEMPEPAPAPPAG